MEEALREHLFDLADAFSGATGVTRATIGKRALNDNTFFVRIERGDGFNIRTFDKLVSWFSDNWPPRTEWPTPVPRPECAATPSDQGAAA